MTGAGIVTSLGLGWDCNETGFRDGRVALREIRGFDVARQRAKTGGEVDLPDARFWLGRLELRRQARLDRATTLLLIAGAEAWEQAGWGEAERSAAVPVILGSSAGAMNRGEDYYKQAVAQPGNRLGQATRVENYQAHAQGRALADLLGIRGPVTMVSNACSSGADAIGLAANLVRAGAVETVLCGGYDALCQLVFAGFDSLQALSPTQPRPFDVSRDGLALGEGAGVLLLESLERARRREAVILGLVQGYGAALDRHHLTQPHPQGDAALEAMEAACRQAGVGPDDIDYINAHGTGTPLNDAAEARAIVRWAGPRAAQIAVSSTKASIGHLLGAAGAVEAIVGLMSLRGQWLPPATVVRVPDPLCEFDLVREPRRARIRRVLTNSFGFGGANASLVLGRFEERP
ncbi:MAG TPA: beta-ketoacyl-[acyl-carrier-protein] synthase family protein [Verrucomicrobiales bacterium]|nr:beta-ketoacyl-[acyl-carrier-protein] synthase family protein [Verrucomicrobiales bacterium]